MAAEQSSQPELDIAIVGGGPRGLYCLERLAAEAVHSRRRIRVDVFEPSGEFGAGSVYRTGQPDHLRMNFADELIDAWPQSNGDGRDPRRRSYAGWLESDGGPDPSGYSPRSRVGAYLRDCFEVVLRDLPPGVDVHPRVTRVERIEAATQGWRVTADGPPRDYDEVMLAVGHRPPGRDDGAEIELSYPLEECLGEARFPALAPLRARGMALTFTDAVLELTEGRGGSFAGRPDGETPLTYVACGREPRPIVGFSRTGRSMLAKPAPGRLVGREDAEAALAPWRDRVRALDDAAFVAELISLLAGAGADLLRCPPADGGIVEPVGAGALRSHLLTRLDPTGPAAQPEARAELERSWLVATRRLPADPEWALGEAWRGLYSAIVERGGHGGVPAEEWPAFAVLATEMERVAFGPPPLNAAKLLALIEAGFVELGGRRPSPRVELDAVLTAPGVYERRGDLVDALLDDGYVRPADGARRGIEVERDGTCIGADGKPTPGLAAVGRITEDWVIGNDTLSRRLHDHPRRWARRVTA